MQHSKRNTIVLISQGDFTTFLFAKWCSHGCVHIHLPWKSTSLASICCWITSGCCYRVGDDSSPLLSQRARFCLLLFHFCKCLPVYLFTLRSLIAHLDSDITKKQNERERNVCFHKRRNEKEKFVLWQCIKIVYRSVLTVILKCHACF